MTLRASDLELRSRHLWGIVALCVVMLACYGIDSEGLDADAMALIAGSLVAIMVVALGSKLGFRYELDGSQLVVRRLGRLSQVYDLASSRWYLPGTRTAPGVFIGFDDGRLLWLNATSPSLRAMRDVVLEQVQRHAGHGNLAPPSSVMRREFVRGHRVGAVFGGLGILLGVAFGVFVASQQEIEYDLIAVAAIYVLVCVTLGAWSGYKAQRIARGLAPLV